MPSPMQKAVLAHWRAMLRVSGVPVTYYATASTTYEITVVPGRTTAENEYDDGRLSTEKSADFLVPYSSLGFLPELGDRILWDGRWYEVLAQGLNRHYEWADHFEVLLRIHTKHVASDVDPTTGWLWQNGDSHVNQVGDTMEFQSTL